MRKSKFLVSILSLGLGLGVLASCQVDFEDSSATSDQSSNQSSNSSTSGSSTNNSSNSSTNNSTYEPTTEIDKEEVEIVDIFWSNDSAIKEDITLKSTDKSEYLLKAEATINYKQVDVEYTVSNSDVLTLNGNVITVKGVGEAEIVARPVGVLTDKYNLVVKVTVELFEPSFVIELSEDFEKVWEVQEYTTDEEILSNVIVTKDDEVVTDANLVISVPEEQKEAWNSRQVGKYNLTITIEGEEKVQPVNVEVEIIPTIHYLSFYVYDTSENYDGLEALWMWGEKGSLLVSAPTNAPESYVFREEVFMNSKGEEVQASTEETPAKKLLKFNIDTSVTYNIGTSWETTDSNTGASLLKQEKLTIEDFSLRNGMLIRTLDGSRQTKNISYDYNSITDGNVYSYVSYYDNTTYPALTYYTANEFATEFFRFGQVEISSLNIFYYWDENQDENNKTGWMTGMHIFGVEGYGYKDTTLIDGNVGDKTYKGFDFDLTQEYEVKTGWSDNENDVSGTKIKFDAYTNFTKIILRDFGNGVQTNDISLDMNYLQKNVVNGHLDIFITVHSGEGNRNFTVDTTLSLNPSTEETK